MRLYVDFMSSSWFHHVRGDIYRRSRHIRSLPEMAGGKSEKGGKDEQSRSNYGVCTGCRFPMCRTHEDLWLRAESGRKWVGESDWPSRISIWVHNRRGHI